MGKETEDKRDYMLERRLKELNPDLHGRFKDTVFVMNYTLPKFTRLFPEFTDHSMFHSLNVLEFCNEIIGKEQMERMNGGELYILLMNTYLHDVGMAITENDYEAFKDRLGAEEYFATMPEATVPRFVRDYHQEFSGLFIEKYADLLEIPSEEAVFAIKQVARGHRHTDLYDEEGYPEVFRLENGAEVSIPYLAALIRLADEIDMVADRNPKLLYDIEAVTDRVQLAYRKLHAAIPRMEIQPTEFIMHVHAEDGMLYLAIEKLAEKMQATLEYCRNVAEKRTPYRITQERVRIERV